ncbi:MAG: NUDIX domain-containing protein [Deltaproteobacteria bacterium]|nr:NUDIX domain-containing protein [Deltaproteobacteria bacterium]
MRDELFQKSCGVVPVRLVDGEPRYLLLHSGLVRNPKATWEFPKGSMEEGESPIQTARRECREETGLCEVRVVEGFFALDTYSFRREGRRIQKQVSYFLGIVDDPSGLKAEPDGREHVLDAEGEWARWLSYEDARTTLYHEGQRAVLACAHAHLVALKILEERAAPAPAPQEAP